MAGEELITPDGERIVFKKGLYDILGRWETYATHKKYPQVPEDEIWVEQLISPTELESLLDFLGVHPHVKAKAMEHFQQLKTNRKQNPYRDAYDVLTSAWRLYQSVHKSFLAYHTFPSEFDSVEPDTAGGTASQVKGAPMKLIPGRYLLHMLQAWQQIQKNLKTMLPCSEWSREWIQGVQHIIDVSYSELAVRVNHDAPDVPSDPKLYKAYYPQPQLKADIPVLFVGTRNEYGDKAPKLFALLKYVGQPGTILGSAGSGEGKKKTRYAISIRATEEQFNVNNFDIVADLGDVTDKPGRYETPWDVSRDNMTDEEWAIIRMKALENDKWDKPGEAPTPPPKPPEPAPPGEKPKGPWDLKVGDRVRSIQHSLWIPPVGFEGVVSEINTLEPKDDQTNEIRIIWVKDFKDAQGHDFGEEQRNEKGWWLYKQKWWEYIEPIKKPEEPAPAPEPTPEGPRPTFKPGQTVIVIKRLGPPPGGREWLREVAEGEPYTVKQGYTGIILSGEGTNAYSVSFGPIKKMTEVGILELDIKERHLIAAEHLRPWRLVEFTGKLYSTPQTAPMWSMNTMPGTNDVIDAVVATGEIVNFKLPPFFENQAWDDLENSKMGVIAHLHMQIPKAGEGQHWHIYAANTVDFKAPPVPEGAEAPPTPEGEAAAPAEPEKPKAKPKPQLPEKPDEVKAFKAALEDVLDMPFGKGTYVEDVPAEYREKGVIAVTPSVSLQKFVKNMDLLRKYFVFARDKDADVFASVWLLKNGSCVLKGSPGTGKTTLVQCGITIWANDPRAIADAKTFKSMLDKLTKGELPIYYEYLDKKGPERDWKWMMSTPTIEPIFALAKHNQDKEPDELFYYTDIATERRKYSESEVAPSSAAKTPEVMPESEDVGSPGLSKREIPGETEAFTPGLENPRRRQIIPGIPAFEYSKGNWRPNPSYISGKGKSEKFKVPEEGYTGFSGDKVDWLDIITFEPQPYPIVTAIVKLQNECFPPGTPILGNPRARMIEDFKAGDKLLGREVVANFARQYNGKIYRIRSLFNIPIEMTENHPVWVDGAWKCAGALKVGDMVSIPKFQPQTRLPTLDLATALPHARGCSYPGCKVALRKEREFCHYHGLHRATKDTEPKTVCKWKVGESEIRYCNQRKSVPRFIPNEPWAWKFMGFWMAEGTTSPHQVRLNVGANDAVLVKEFDAAFAAWMGSAPQVRWMGNRGYMNIGHAPLAKFLKSEFGGNAREKTIPSWVLSAPKEQALEFIRGYFQGDGHYGNSRTGFVLQTASISIALLFQRLASRFGVLVSIAPPQRGCYRLVMRGPNAARMLGVPEQPQVFRRYKETPNEFLVPIRSIKIREYDGLVYNIETSDHIIEVPFSTHNSNRMNNNVADAMLGLLAENQVEYRGKPFTSPKDGQGSLNFFDYNPHLDLPPHNMEMDRALLDRIDVGLYLPGGDVRTRLKVLIKDAFQSVMGIKKPEQMDAGAKGAAAPAFVKGKPEESIFAELQSGAYEPVTPFELRRIWRALEQVPVSSEAVLWVSYLTNLPNFSDKLYGKPYLGPAPKGGGDAVLHKDMLDAAKGDIPKYMDTTTMTYKRGSEGGDADSIESTTDDASMYRAHQRPFGFRSALALTKLLKAYHAIAASKRKGRSGGGELKNRDVAFGFWPDETTKKEEVLNTMGDLLPYVLDHRVNIGVGSDMQEEYANYFDFVKYNFVNKLLRTGIYGSAREDPWEGKFVRWIEYIADMFERPMTPLKRVEFFRREFSDVFGDDYAERRSIFLDWFLDLAATPNEPGTDYPLPFVAPK